MKYISYIIHIKFIHIKFILRYKKLIYTLEWDSCLLTKFVRKYITKVPSFYSDIFCSIKVELCCIIYTALLG